jgi:hypothetical protein
MSGSPRSFLAQVLLDHAMARFGLSSRARSISAMPASSSCRTCASELPAALPGNERIDALTGVDTITVGFKLTDATVSFVGNTVIIDGPSSHTVLTGFEVFNFTDGTVNNNDADPLVDDLFYYSQYHDVWNAHVDADQHYHQYGWHEGRDPDAFYSTSTYLSANPDVRAAGVDPLLHFDQFGWKEDRFPSINFDPAAYLGGCGQNVSETSISICDPNASRPNQLVKVALSLAPIDKLGSPRMARSFGRADDGMGLRRKLAANKSHTIAPVSRIGAGLATRAPKPIFFTITTSPLTVGTMKRLA